MSEQILQKENVFGFMTPEQIDALSNASEVIEKQTGDTIYQRGENTKYFYVVLDGSVALRLPENGSESILIDEIEAGNMFGSCISLEFGTYFCSAQCTKQAHLLRVDTATLKKILDRDCCMGYAIQSRISQIYFERYMKTMKKLQSQNPGQ